jgi:hypothetical protein
LPLPASCVEAYFNLRLSAKASRYVKATLFIFISFTYVLAGPISVFRNGIKIV